MDCDFSGSHRCGRSKSTSKKFCTDFKCGGKGHCKKECTSIEKGSQRNVTSTLGGGEILFKAATVVESKQKFCDTWIIDLGSTWHMTSQREW